MIHVILVASKKNEDLITSLRYWIFCFIPIELQRVAVLPNTFIWSTI